MFKTEGHSIFFGGGKFLCILAYIATHSLDFYLNRSKTKNFPKVFSFF